MSGASTDLKTPCCELNMKVIHLCWQGPIPLTRLAEEPELLNDSKQDYGLYQIYGEHVTYGSGSLLYIGMADAQTFAVRLKQHDWCDERTIDGLSLEVHVGRFVRRSDWPEPSWDEWSKQIRRVERLLICSHLPAWNSQGLRLDESIDTELQDLLVLNSGKCRRLLPEVSGACWTSLFMDDDEWPCYGKDAPKEE